MNVLVGDDVGFLFAAVRLLIRLAHSLLRFLVALLFGPVAPMLWAILQTD